MIDQFLEQAVMIVWGIPVVILCLFAGFWFTLRLSFVQIRCFPHALALLRGKYDNPDDPGHITHFQALSAALSGTIGIGNIAGVAIAISMGGPGAIFWMWIIAFLGMATKYAECALGTLYREKNPETGEFRGGPMYYIKNGLGEKWKPLAAFVAFCGAIGCLGGTMLQSNQAVSALDLYYGIPTWVMGVVVSVAVAIVIIGGIRSIGKVASKLVPFMCIAYVLGALGICFSNLSIIPTVLETILHDAFTGHAVIGGSLGTVIMMGVRRAVYSNEAGMGTAPIAHAAVKTEYPIREGIVASIGPFIDTIVVCTATAIVIIAGGYFGTERYTPQGEVNISFEKDEPLHISGAWSITQDAPPETEKLRKFRDGRYVLKCEIAEQWQSANVTIPAIPIAKISQNEQKRLCDGIRFSSYGNGVGSRKVEVMANGKIVCDLQLRPEGDIIESRGISITPSGRSDTWHSFVILLNEKFAKSQNAGTPIEEISLRFTATGKETTWYVDRIQPITTLEGIGLTTTSFDNFFPGFGSIFVVVAVLLFGYSTMITLSYYGETGAFYIFGTKAILPYKMLFILAMFVGAIAKLRTVLNFTDLVVGLMVIPNVIVVMVLSGKVKALTQEYFGLLRAGHFK